MAIRKIIKRATDALFTNSEFDGTEATRMVKGTTGQRASAEAGDLRFNTTTSLMEYYDGTIWKSIDAPPIISSIDPSDIADSDSDVDIVITGSNFSTSPTVTAIGSDASVITPTTVVRDSATQITATFDGTDFSDAQEDYDIKVENVSGLSNTLADALAVNATPVWTVASGSLGTFNDSGRTGISITTGATDDEGATLTYAVASGSLPSGLSMSTSTGTITGDADAVGSDTTSNFTLSVTDGANTTTRAYSITINAPVITSYTSTGSGTFSVPSGLTAVDVLVVAGGGGGGDNQGAGGAGGLIYRPAFPVTPGGSVSYTVGAGGDGATGTNATPQITGQDSAFGSLTAKGGGAGGAEFGPGPQSANGQNGTGYSGGSGGGGCYPAGGYGSGIQPQQPGDSGTYGFGNHGGNGQGANPYATGGGGGAGAQGGQAGGQLAGNGGNGKQYDISGSQVYYAGGGGGGVTTSPTPGRGSGGQGGGGEGGNPGTPLATPGVANRGGGGGSNGENAGQGSNPGGSGIVIVKY